MSFRFHRLRVVAGVVLAAILSVAGCVRCKKTPDQSRFAPLEQLSRDDNAVVRLYAAPIPTFELIAMHAWFVVKPTGSDTFERWELWQNDRVTPPPDGAHYGHVYRNLRGPTRDVGADGTRVLAELTGPEADRIARFIRSQSPYYPWRSQYAYLGPNSNTYVQWVLDHTGWNVRLPPGAIGKDWWREEVQRRPADSQPSTSRAE